MEGKGTSEGIGTSNTSGKEHVSFGMDMTTDEEESELGNVEQGGRSGYCCCSIPCKKNWL
jgi:hypothetical protein